MLIPRKHLTTPVEYCTVGLFTYWIGSSFLSLQVIKALASDAMSVEKQTHFPLSTIPKSRNPQEVDAGRLYQRLYSRPGTPCKIHVEEPGGRSHQLHLFCSHEPVDFRYDTSLVPLPSQQAWIKPRFKGDRSHAGSVATSDGWVHTGCLCVCTIVCPQYALGWVGSGFRANLM